MKAVFGNKPERNSEFRIPNLNKKGVFGGMKVVFGKKPERNSEFRIPNSEFIKK